MTGATPPGNPRMLNGGSGGSGGSRGSRSRASVRINALAEGAESAAPVDPGTKSLGDALKIMYRFLQFLMAVIVIAYVASGSQTISASERGIRLTFGRVVESDIPPGLTPVFPEPVGELIKIDTSNQSMKLNKEFFVNLTETELSNLNRSGTTTLAGGGLDSLDPDIDGMLLTGDGAIAHARVEVSYRRADPVGYARGVDPNYERPIVASSVRRGIVQTAARVTLDEFINDQMDPSLRDGDARTISHAAREASQRILDQMKLGIQLTEFNILDRIPPRRVMSEFARVQSATQAAEKQIEEARSYRKDKLIETAGFAAEPILRLIAAYEDQLAAGRAAEAERTLSDIDALLEGKAIKTAQGETLNPSLTGSVTKILDEARQYRNAAVSEAQSALATFQAKRAVYKADPRVMIATEWSRAFGAFMRRKTTQAMLLPPMADRIVLQLNRDPKILQRLEKEQYEAQTQKANEARRLQMDRERHTEKLDAERMQPAEQ